jgi:hypothetical protein
MALLSFTKQALLDQEVADLPWHLPEITRWRLHLSPTGEFTQDRQLEGGVLEYRTNSSDELSFTYTFPANSMLIGPSTLVIDIAAPDHDDLDTHAHIFKANASETFLSHLNMPIPPNTPASTVETMTQNRIWRYQGPNGMIWASKRHVSDSLSGKTWITLSLEHEEKIKPGEVVRLRVQLWPTGIVYEAGEQLVLKVSERQMGLPALPELLEPTSANKGNHVLHIGGSHEANLQFSTI